MGIADFFFGEKQQDIPSLNDVILQQRGATPENIFGPGFQIQTQFRGGPGSDLRPIVNLLEDPAIRSSRETQQASSAAGALNLGQFAQPIAADTEAADRVERALFERGLGLLEPIREQRRERTLQGLSDRGLPAGSAARQEALELLGQQETEELNDLVLRALLGREQVLGQQVSRETQARNQFINQIQQLLAPPNQVPFAIPQSTLSTGDILAPGAQQATVDQARQRQFTDLLSGLISGGGRIGAAFAGG